MFNGIRQVQPSREFTMFSGKMLLKVKMLNVQCSWCMTLIIERLSSRNTLLETGGGTHGGGPDVDAEGFSWDSVYDLAIYSAEKDGSCQCGSDFCNQYSTTCCVPGINNTYEGFGNIGERVKNVCRWRVSKRTLFCIREGALIFIQQYYRGTHGRLRCVMEG